MSSIILHPTSSQLTSNLLKPGTHPGGLEPSSQSPRCTRFRRCHPRAPPHQGLRAIAPRVGSNRHEHALGECRSGFFHLTFLTNCSKKYMSCKQTFCLKPENMLQKPKQTKTGDVYKLRSPQGRFVFLGFLGMPKGVSPPAAPGKWSQSQRPAGWVQHSSQMEGTVPWRVSGEVVSVGVETQPFFGWKKKASMIFNDQLSLLLIVTEVEKLDVIGQFMEFILNKRVSCTCVVCLFIRKLTRMEWEAFIHLYSEVRLDLELQMSNICTRL